MNIHVYSAWHLCITVWLSENYLNSILERQSPVILLSEYSDMSVRITWESMRGRVQEEKVLVNCKSTCYNKSVYYFAYQVLQVLLQSKQIFLHFPGQGIASTLLGSTRDASKKGKRAGAELMCLIAFLLFVFNAIYWFSFLHLPDTIMALKVLEKWFYIFFFLINFFLFTNTHYLTRQRSLFFFTYK